MDQLHEDILSNEQDLDITGEAGNCLIETSKWAKFIAVTFYILTALGVLFFLFFGSQIWSVYTRRRYFDGSDETSAYMIGMVLGFIIAVAVVAVTYYFLLNFANKIRIGIEGENIDAVNNGLKSLKIHFIIIGILLILGILYNLYTFSK